MIGKQPSVNEENRGLKKLNELLAKGYDGSSYSLIYSNLRLYRNWRKHPSEPTFQIEETFRERMIKSYGDFSIPELEELMNGLKSHTLEYKE